jgi:hypothetical protein
VEYVDVVECLQTAAMADLGCMSFLGPAPMVNFAADMERSCDDLSTARWRQDHQHHCTQAGYPYPLAGSYSYGGCDEAHQGNYRGMIRIHTAAEERQQRRYGGLVGVQNSLRDTEVIDHNMYRHEEHQAKSRCTENLCVQTYGQLANFAALENPLITSQRRYSVVPEQYLVMAVVSDKVYKMASSSDFDEQEGVEVLRRPEVLVAETGVLIRIASRGSVMKGRRGLRAACTGLQVRIARLEARRTRLARNFVEGRHKVQNHEVTRRRVDTVDVEVVRVRGRCRSVYDRVAACLGHHTVAAPDQGQPELNKNDAILVDYRACRKVRTVAEVGVALGYSVRIVTSRSCSSAAAPGVPTAYHSS